MALASFAVKRERSRFGIAMAASLLAVFAGGEVIGVEAFKPVFIVMALITASAALGFWQLKPNDGWEISGHRIKPKESKEDGS